MRKRNIRLGSGSRGGNWFELPARPARKIFFIVKCAFVLLLAGAIAYGAVHFGGIISRPHGWKHFHSIPWSTYEHPNKKKLEDARALVQTGKLVEARNIITDALTTAPRSPFTRDLRDLLGGINTQIFFSTQPSPRKTEYSVRSGDALSSIARRLKSSADLIMRVNDLDSTLIRVGDVLTVPQLDFTITIDLARERVIVHDGRGFFTQYPIVSVDLPRFRKPMVQTVVSAKAFWANGQPIRNELGDVREGTPWIYLMNHHLVLYGVDEEGQTNESDIAIIEEPASGTKPEKSAQAAKQPAQGIAMLTDDIRELELLIGKGTPVTIVLDRQ